MFKELGYTSAVNAIIEGNRPGKIYVDDMEFPKTAFAWAKPSEYYLVGCPNNNEFNFALHKLITNAINPETVNHKIRFSVLHCSEDVWDKKINVILKNQHYRKSYRWLFTFKQLKVNCKRRIPKGFHIECINEEFLKRTSLKNLNTVADYIIFKWNSINDFLQKGFGFCLLHGNSIASWCISGNHVEGKCEITIGTHEKYQNKGCATLIASAFVEHCISKNLTPSWHCGYDNLASIAVAEKVGFEKVLKYPVYIWTPTTKPDLFWRMKNKLKKLVPTLPSPRFKNNQL